MFRARYGLYWLLGIVTLVGSLAGTITWFVDYIVSLANTSNQSQVISPIELAAVTATLGGLVLVGAFYKGTNERATREEYEVTTDLKLIGKIILISAVCFIITYFLLGYVHTLDSPFSPRDYFFLLTTDVAAAVAVLALSLALCFLVTVMRFI